MKLSEMKNKKNGLPEGFVGTKTKWEDVKEPFQILKAAILQRPALNEAGEVMVYSQGPNEGKPIPDRQLVLAIMTESGKELLVRTNSRRLTSLYSGDLDREPDARNYFDDEIYLVEAPEGWLQFVPFKYKYSNGREGDIADLEEIED